LLSTGIYKNKSYTKVPVPLRFVYLYHFCGGL